MSTDDATTETPEAGAWRHTCMTPGDETTCPGCRARAEAEPEVGPYAEAVAEYLTEADWLTAADAPLKVHVRQIAKSLDSQISKSGEVQSALASTFAKVLGMLDRRRPGPPPADPLTAGTGPHGEASIFTLVGDE